MRSGIPVNNEAPMMTSGISSWVLNPSGVLIGVGFAHMCS
jgi:hypothetical protein